MFDTMFNSLLVWWCTTNRCKTWHCWCITRYVELRLKYFAPHWTIIDSSVMAALYNKIRKHSDVFLKYGMFFLSLFCEIVVFLYIEKSRRTPISYKVVDWFVTWCDDHWMNQSNWSFYLLCWLWLAEEITCTDQS